ncbi:hypothetical protein CNR22_09735 [Sphingobacteriaceae bacterium]|nr:hypothetical protein CNR22_09735 [Sphingobacteriaceae bacterium]
MGFVACEKANTRPCSEKSSNTSSGNSDVSGKIVGGVYVDDNANSGTGTTIVGSGDDDRDGGDKKKKIR